MGNPFISLQSPWAGVFYETTALFSLLTAGEWGCLKAILQEDLCSYAGVVDAYLYLNFELIKTQITSLNNTNTYSRC